MHDMNVEALRANSSCELARLYASCALAACLHAQKATEPQPSTPA
jgi:hypothetical protein